MSTPAASGAAAEKNGDRRMSLGKYVKRMSSVFRREKQGKSSSSDAVVVSSVPGIHEEVAKDGGPEQEAELAS